MIDLDHPRSLFFSLPFATDSLNRVLRMHWAARKKRNDSLVPLIRASTTPEQRRGRPAERIGIMRYGPKLLDHDNAIGGCKSLIDALVKARVIEDDAGVYIGLEQRKGKPRTEVWVLWR